jgi:hypothetical protein
MKNNLSKLRLAIAVIAFLALGMSSCSKLDEKLFGSKSEVTAAAGT